MVALAFVTKAPLNMALCCNVKFPERLLPVAYDALPALSKETEFGLGGARTDGRMRNASKTEMTMIVTARTKSCFRILPVVHVTAL